MALTSLHTHGPAPRLHTPLQPPPSVLGSLVKKDGEVTSIITGNYSTDSWPLLATTAQHMTQSGDDGVHRASGARQGELTFLSKLQG